MSLRIGVDEKDLFLCEGEAVSDVNRRRGLADAALPVRYGDFSHFSSLSSRGNDSGLNCPPGRKSWGYFVLRNLKILPMSS